MIWFKIVFRGLTDYIESTSPLEAVTKFSKQTKVMIGETVTVIYFFPASRKVKTSIIVYDGTNFNIKEEHIVEE